jgi:tudor domain-containing protein 1/4/6/7
MNAIGTYCDSWPLVAPRTPLLGELCCAKFSTDKVWYRARVIAFLSLSECRVRFLDYGNCEVCAVSAMLPATSELLSLPALAIPCSLVGWEDSGEEEGGGESEVNQRFKSLAENQSLQAVQKMWRNGRAVLEMSGADGPIQL